MPRALPAAESYSFDATGNRQLAGGSSNSADGAFNRVQNDGTYTYDYDAEGNQIRRTYLAELQRHDEQVRAAPADWMPWNYREQVIPTAGVPDAARGPPGEHACAASPCVALS